MSTTAEQRKEHAMLAVAARFEPLGEVADNGIVVHAVDLQTRE